MANNLRIPREPIELEAPEGATHIAGDEKDWPDVHFKFYKRKEIGVAGDHWFLWEREEKRWTFCGHNAPGWIREIPNEWRF